MFIYPSLVTVDQGVPYSTNPHRFDLSLFVLCGFTQRVVLSQCSRVFVKMFCTFLTSSLFVALCSMARPPSRLHVCHVEVRDLGMCFKLAVLGNGPV